MNAAQRDHRSPEHRRIGLCAVPYDRPVDLSGMDFAGLAALLGVPALLITALLPLRDRAVLQRLERIDQLLRDTDLDDEHALLLRAARQHLVRRVVVAELTPGLGVWGWTSMTIVAVLGVYSAFQAVEHYRYWDWVNGIVYTIAATAGIGGFLVGLAAGPAVQRRQTDLIADRFAGESAPEPVIERQGILRRWRIVRRSGGGEAGSERVEE